MPGMGERGEEKNEGKVPRSLRNGRMERRTEELNEAREGKEGSCPANEAAIKALYGAISPRRLAGRAPLSSVQASGVGPCRSNVQLLVSRKARVGTLQSNKAKRARASSVLFSFFFLSFFLSFFFLGGGFSCFIHHHACNEYQTSCKLYRPTPHLLYRKGWVSLRRCQSTIYVQDV